MSGSTVILWNYKNTFCVRNQHWQSCLSCSCLMFLCLFCVWAHGSVSVCVCHVPPLYHLPASPGHAPLFSPCLVLVCLIVFTWSSCALLLYIVFFPLVSLLVRFGCYRFHGLRGKLWSCASYFDLAQVIIFFFVLLSCYIISLFSLVLVFFDFVNLYLVLFSLYLDLTLTLFLQFQFPFWILAFCFYFLIYLVWIIYCFYLCSLFFCLVSFVLSWVSSCLLSCFALSCPLPRFSGLWPLLPGSSSPLSLVKFLVLWVPTWQLDFCDFWDPLHATGSLLSCLSLPLELPPPCSSSLPPRTGSVVLSLLCCLPCPSVWTDSLSTLPAISSQCPVNKLQLSAHLHLGPISCWSLTFCTQKNVITDIEEKILLNKVIISLFFCTQNVFLKLHNITVEPLISNGLLKKCLY